MKFLFLFSALFVLVNCVNQRSAIKDKNTDVNKMIQPNPTVDNLNANNFVSISDEASKIDNAERGRLEKQNEEFRNVSDEFKKVDFENFSYPYKLSYNQKKYLSISRRAKIMIMTFKATVDGFNSLTFSSLI